MRYIPPTNNRGDAPRLVADSVNKLVNKSKALESTAVALAAADTALEGDITALQGDVTTLQTDKADNSRVDVVSNFASPNAGGVIVGEYYDNSFHGTASTTLAGAADRIDLAPFYTSSDMPIDQIGVAVSTAAASSTVKIVIYESGTDGWPSNLLHETGDIATSSGGYASEGLTFTFLRGKKYWLGVRHSSNPTLRSINLSSAANLGLTSGSAGNYITILRRTLAYATAATDPWAFVSADRTGNVAPPSIRFRAA